MAVLIGVAVFLWAIGSSVESAAKRYRTRMHMLHRKLEAQRAELGRVMGEWERTVNPPKRSKPKLVYSRKM